MSTLGLTFVLDTNVTDDDSFGMGRLWRLREEGMIDLARTDVMDTELSQAEGEKKARLLGLSAALPEMLGVWVLGHSRLGSTVLGSDRDSSQWDRVWQVMSPGRDRATANRKHVRDAMHVWTAIRYGANAFVTLDGSGGAKGILERAAMVKAEFDGFCLYMPDQAADFAGRLRTRWEYRMSHPAGSTGAATRLIRARGPIGCQVLLAGGRVSSS